MLNVFMLNRLIPGRFSSLSQPKWIGCLALILAGLCAPIARAQVGGEAKPATAQPLVVLVGIDKYNDPQIKSRQHDEADAKAIYDLFASKDNPGANPKNVKL